MKTINKYVDEISKREFKTREEAIKSEKKNGGIKKLFAFWKEAPKDKTCDFANGGWCYQRTEGEWYQLREALVKGIKEYEPWIAEEYEKHGGLTKEHIQAGYFIGRYLDDGNSELYHQYGILCNICPQCFREWGQMYHATHCNHKEKARLF